MSKLYEILRNKTIVDSFAFNGDKLYIDFNNDAFIRQLEYKTFDSYSGKIEVGTKTVYNDVSIGEPTFWSYKGDEDEIWLYELGWNFEIKLEEYHKSEDVENRKFNKSDNKIYDELKTKILDMLELTKEEYIKMKKNERDIFFKNKADYSIKEELDELSKKKEAIQKRAIKRFEKSMQETDEEDLKPFDNQIEKFLKTGDLEPILAITMIKKETK